MRIISPVEIGESNLVASNAVNEDYPAWTPGTYSTGDKVIVDLDIYEARTETTDEPTAGAKASPATWLRLGFVNQMRMFRGGRDSLTTREESLDVTITVTDTVDSLGLIGMSGVNVTVTMTFGSEGEVYRREEALADLGVSDYWEYFFLPVKYRQDLVLFDLPPYPGAEIRIQITAQSTAGSIASIGRLVIGSALDVGKTVYGTAPRSLNFGIQKEDGFGNLELTPRRVVRLLDYRVVIDAQRDDYVLSELEQLHNRVALFVGTPDKERSITIGVIRRLDPVYQNYGQTTLSLEVRGL